MKQDSVARPAPTPFSRFDRNTNSGSGHQNSGINVYINAPSANDSRLPPANDSRLPPAPSPEPNNEASHEPKLPQPPQGWFYRHRLCVGITLIVVILTATLVPIGAVVIEPHMRHDEATSNQSSSSMGPSFTTRLDPISLPSTSTSASDMSILASITKTSSTSPSSSLQFTSSSSLPSTRIDLSKTSFSTSTSSSIISSPLPKTLSESPTLATSTTKQTTSTVQPPATTTPPSCQYHCIDPSNCVWGCPGASCSDYNGCIDPYPCNTVAQTCCNTGCFSGWSCQGSCLSPLSCYSATAGPDQSTCA